MYVRELTFDLHESTKNKRSFKFEGKDDLSYTSLRLSWLMYRSRVQLILDCGSYENRKATRYWKSSLVEIMCSSQNVSG